MGSTCIKGHSHSTETNVDIKTLLTIDDAYHMTGAQIFGVFCGLSFCEYLSVAPLRKLIFEYFVWPPPQFSITPVGDGHNQVRFHRVGGRVMDFSMSTGYGYDWMNGYTIGTRPLRELLFTSAYITASVDRESSMSELCLISESSIPSGETIKTKLLLRQRNKKFLLQRRIEFDLEQNQVRIFNQPYIEKIIQIPNLAEQHLCVVLRGTGQLTITPDPIEHALSIKKVPKQNLPPTLPVHFDPDRSIFDDDDDDDSFNRCHPVEWAEITVSLPPKPSHSIH
jgi:hypothetical protein